VIVNQSFAKQFFGGRSPIGHRVREVPGDGATPEDWKEIVGVVRDLAMKPSEPSDAAGVYHLAGPGQLESVRMAVRVGPGAEAFIPRLRAIVTEVDPTIRLHDLVPLDVASRPDQLSLRTLAAVLVSLAAIALFLSSAGIHALMSFIVTRRTREIGIRVALGGQTGNIMGAVFSRAILQLGAGAAIGATIDAMGPGAQRLPIEGPTALIVAVVVALLIGLAACALPVIRAMRVQPIDALRES
jgi:putative ABC transport system permease protein